MSTNSMDTKALVSLLEQLEQAVKQNQEVIDTIRREVEAQHERRLRQIEKLAGHIVSQKQALKALLDQVEDGALFPVSEDQGTISDLTSTLTQRMNASQKLVDYSAALLSDNGAEPKKEAKNEAPAASSAALAPGQFVKDVLLGNWIHHFSGTLFTCQSFWDDGAFKEYDFKNSKLLEEREGTYEVQDGKVILTYEDGKKHEYLVDDFTEDYIGYIIEGRKVRFDYMPETVLNSFLEPASKAQA